ncbi:bifunctional diaminohydroxyphosphoribosylaminopyrimidine deaminase/5-amino-6-(5-phosphoribosylamino)uracil reductase RibD [Desulfotruncus alcoholivorax]|uniref:bifunctional diaminohydroxyphosphoribosylaminopyrimidine deaminase/5-amino-6-(5-phosphoribosylamino)uracil reductase RibD n=1 Tax=Desulfotruncus alcoholivorax TaxID=265477 RepID=UPI00040EC287|nr:bifunctional diaminohydroxyphosphoribosylaminopyrimidine deaminase/5-amino-6-(5-phosphoribosylamino)uracil reductase RibD [Desulfotruncus alcoholivorax]
MDDKDLKYMELALELAAKALGRTSPNPVVGAVVVKDGRIVGKGYHARAGTPHAEIHALREAGEDAAGATLYVTLEPCCHHGRTGPCTDAVIRAGIKRVVLAMTDPNPLVAGKGAQKLRDAGIEVVCGVREAEARRLNEVFIKYISTGRPYVVLKTAMSLDGKIATAGGESKWITGPRAREHVHLLRDRYDAILVGIGTVLADDPSLTTRLPDREGRDPVRVILDSGAATPPGAKILTQNSQAQTIIVTTGEAPPDKVKRLERAGAVVIKVPGHDEGVSLPDTLRELAGREITSVLVEGGARVNGSFIKEKLVDKVYWYIAPKIIGGGMAPGPVGGPGIQVLNDALQVENIEVYNLGNDICIEGYISKGGSKGGPKCSQG